MSRCGLCDTRGKVYCICIYKLSILCHSTQGHLGFKMVHIPKSEHRQNDGRGDAYFASGLRDVLYACAREATIYRPCIVWR